jgi:hypothetical protein
LLVAIIVGVIWLQIHEGVSTPLLTFLLRVLNIPSW